MKKIILILVFVVSFLGATDLVEGVSETIKIASEIEEVDGLFQYILYEMNSFFTKEGLFFELWFINTAKLVLSLVILGLSWVVRFFISMIFRLFEKNEFHLFSKIIVSVKGPLLLFLVFWSIYWSAKIVYYPDILSLEFESFFNTIHLFTGGWLLWNLLSSYEEFVLERKGRTLKVEEVDLMVSSSKILLFVIIVLITIYMYWPNTLKYIGGAGFILAFALKDSVASYMATFKLVIELDFSVGDWVKYFNGEGTIDKIGLINTKIRTFDMGLLLVPNSELTKDSVINYSRRTVRRVKFDFYLPINLHSNKIRKILVDVKEMIKKHPNISYNKVLNKDKKKDVIAKRKAGFSDTLMVNLINVEHGNKVNVYAFTNKDDWQFQLDTQEDIILKIKEILEGYGCSMIIEAKYLQNPFEEKKNVQKNELIEIKKEKE